MEVTSLHDDTYYGNIVVEVDGRTLDIDSRPSDAIALAVRAHVPIWVALPILESVGVTPEEDLQIEPPKKPSLMNHLRLRLTKKIYLFSKTFLKILTWTMKIQGTKKKIRGRIPVKKTGARDLRDISRWFPSGLYS